VISHDNHNDNNNDKDKDNGIDMQCQNSTRASKIMQYSPSAVSAALALRYLHSDRSSAWHADQATWSGHASTVMQRTVVRS
jgi:hypothetical protein